MARTRKKKGTEETVADATQESGGAVAVAELPTETAVETVTAGRELETNSRPMTAEEPPFTPTGSYSPSVEHNDGQDKPASRGQFRSWVTDPERGYSRMSDEEHQRLVVQFEQRPPADVLTALKDGGFRFQPDYYGQKNAWVRRNDFEGRVQVEAMEKLFKAVVPGKESPDR